MKALCRGSYKRLWATEDATSDFLGRSGKFPEGGNINIIKEEAEFAKPRGLTFQGGENRT